MTKPVHTNATIRSEILTRLASVLGQMPKGHCRGVLIEGPHGSGKTVLIESLLQLARSHDMPCHRTRPWLLPLFAYGTLVPAFEALARRSSHSKIFVQTLELLSPQLKEKHEFPRNKFSSGAEFQHTLSDLIEQALDGKPAVVVVENVERLEPSSLSFLCHCLKQSKAPLLFLMSVCRSRDPKLTPLIEILNKGSHEIVTLDPLDKEKVKALCTVLGYAVPLEDAPLDRLLEYTEGNAGFVRELIVSASAQSKGDWAAAFMEQAPVEGNYREALGAKIKKLSPNALELAQILALHGQPLPQRVWVEASGLAGIDFDVAQAALVTHGFVRSQEDRYVVSSQLLQDQILATSGESTQRRHHVALCDAFKKIKPPYAALGFLYHAVQAKAWTEAWPFLIKEGQRAEGCGAAEEAVALFQPAFAAAESDQQTNAPAVPWDASEVVARCARNLDPKLSQTLCEKLVGHFEENSRSPSFFRKLFFRTPPTLVNVLQAADDPSVKLTFYRLELARGSLLLGDFEKVLVVCKQALESLKDKNSAVRSLFLLCQAEAYGEMGLEATARLHAKAALENAQKTHIQNEPKREINRIIAQSYVLLDNLKVRFGLRTDGKFWKEAQTLAGDQPFPDVQGMLLLGQAEQAASQGRSQEYKELVPKLEEAAQGLGPIYRMRTLVPALRLALLEGSWKDAQAKAEELLERSETFEWCRGLILARMGLTLVKFHAQDIKDAFTQIHKGITLARTHQTLEAVEAMGLLAECFLALDNMPEAKNLLEEARESLTTNMEAGSSLPAMELLRLEGRLARKNKDLTGAEEHLKEALGLADQENNPCEEAKVFEELGKLFDARQDAVKAKECLEAARGKWMILGNDYRVRRVAQIQERLSSGDSRKSEIDTGGLMAPPENSINAPPSQDPTKERGADFTQRLSRSEIINEFSRWVTSSLDINKVLTHVIDQVMAIVTADRGFLILLGEDGQFQNEVVRYKKGRPTIERSLKAKNFSRTIAQKVLETGAPIFIGDVQNASSLKEAQSLLDMDIRTVMCMPLKAEGKVIGLVYVDRQSVTNTFTKEDLELVDSMTTYATLALVNARLHSTVVERVEKLQMLNDLARVISSANELMGVLRTVLKYCLEVSRAEQGYVFLGKELECRLSSDKEGREIKTIQASKSILQKAISTGKSVIITDMSEEEEMSQSASVMNLNIQSVICVPLVLNGQVLGAVYVSSRSTNKQLEQRDMVLLEAILAQASVAVENAQLLENQKKYILDLERALKLYQQAQARANTDTLTGLANHGYFKEHLNREYSFAKRYDVPLSVMFIDLDYFKEINDTYGHQVGDWALQRIAKVIIQAVRGSDLAARYGGDEMAVVLPNTNREQAFLLAERLRTKIQEINLKDVNGPEKIGTSIGLAEMHGGDADASAFLHRVDQALYMAKEGGRGRVYQWGQNQDPEVTKAEYQNKNIVNRRGKKEAGDVLGALKAIVQTRDTSRHWSNPAMQSVIQKLGEKLKLSEKQAKDLEMACVLRDIGNIGMPDVILLKSGKLEPSEWKLLQDHTKVGRDLILQASGDLKDIAEAVYYHHERWNGSGYPEQKKGTDIPILSRVIGVVDAYGAMISERPYRPAMEEKEAVTRLQAGAGEQFDPEVVKLFLECIEEVKNPESKTAPEKKKPT